MTLRRLFVYALWMAFFCRGAVHAVLAPMWDGYDEPAHLAYILFICDHGRPPGFTEPSFPQFFIDANRYLPSTVRVGAPTFPEWRAMTPAARDKSRAMADYLARNPRRYLDYQSGNYERQQGPLFYYIAALPAMFLRHLTLPKLVVAMRLFCVLLASLAVPIAARLFDELGGEKTLAIGLPLFALLPNALFAFDRISNEVLAFPLMTAIALEMLRLSPAGSRRTGRLGAGVTLGLLTAAGLFTRSSFLAVIPAIAVALWLWRRRDAVATAFGIPVVAAFILLGWNKTESGHFSGFVEQQSAGSNVTASDVSRALAYIRRIPIAPDMIRNHLWSGGWGFVKPPDWVYVTATLAILATLIAAAVTIRRRGWRGPPPRLLWPFVTAMVVFVAALMAHLVSAALAAVKAPGSVTVGAGGWYLDEIRAMEVAVIASIIAAATSETSARRVGQAFIIVCGFADLAGTALLLLPRWGGYAGHPIGLDVYLSAVQAAPIRRVVALPAIGLIAWMLAIIASLYCLQAAQLRRAERSH